MVKITGVEERSYAKRHNVISGDILVSINGNEINDILDYRFYLADRSVELLLLRDGTEYTVTIKKGEYDDIGLDFETPLMDKKQTCKNKCIFCFIDQNPEGMRESIYFKDDDSRLSFIHGNYITLTNMSDSDIARIVKMRISSVNISVHTTNPDLRVKMMKNKRSGEVLKYLDEFKKAGLSMCGQIVLCRGINDGEELKRTLSDLSGYYPSMSSVAIVPAGLTKHREGLYPLSDFTADEAKEVIATVDEYREKHRAEFGTALFFCADEFYLKAGLPIPPTEYYEDYPQIENGVGMLRSFSDEFGMAVEDIQYIAEGFEGERTVSVAVGVAAYPMIKRFADSLMAIYPTLHINVWQIINNFFGESITVTGLLTGKDTLEQLSGKELGEELLISSTMLRSEGDLFLCGMSKDELSEALGVPIRAISTDGYAFAEALFG